jgi:Raf kinase inhibitor-like YbhB/YbcL family protein
MNLNHLFCCIFLGLLILTACTPASKQTTTVPTETKLATEVTIPTKTIQVTQTSTSIPPTPQPFEISITVLEESNMIPTLYSCNGENKSLPISWGEPPEGTQSLALLLEDPDAVAVAGYVWVHWLVFNLPSETRSLPEAIPNIVSLTIGGIQGTNSWKEIGYGGPCPPSGTHHYIFTLYALDTMLDADSSLTKGLFEAKISGHVLAETELETIYRNH